MTVTAAPAVTVTVTAPAAAAKPDSQPALLAIVSERTGETWADGDGDRVDVGELDARRVAGATQRRDQRLEVRAARDLGHDATEAGVQIHRTRNRVGEQRRAAHEADACLVARTLDAEDEGFAGGGEAHRVSFRSLRMMTASTSPGW